MTEQDPRLVEESSMQATGAAVELQDPVVEEEEISLKKRKLQKAMEFQFEADISMKNATSLASGNITMEWRGQQHASRAVESTASGATAAIPLTSSPVNSSV